MSEIAEAIETTAEPATNGSGDANPSPAQPAIQLCTHVMPSGATCGCPAVGGTKLCFHHSAVKTALGRVTPLEKVPYGIFSPIPFVFAEDAASLEINYQLLLQAVAEKRVDKGTGTLLFRILRSMADNLKNPLIAQNPASHGEGDKINPQPEPAPAPKTEKSEKTASTAAPALPETPAEASTPKKRIRPADNPELKAAIEALPPNTRHHVNHFLAQRDYLSDMELQYFSLPPYDKPENKPEPTLPDPLSPSVQRIIALSCERP